MPLYFSPGAVAFFDEELHDTMPADVVAITANRHRQLMAEQATGRIIVAGPDSQPRTIPPAPASDDRLIAALRRRRDRLLSACDHTQMADAPLAGDQRALWRNYRQALRDLPETVADLSAIDWPTPPAKGS